MTTGFVMPLIVRSPVTWKVSSPSDWTDVDVKVISG